MSLLPVADALARILDGVQPVSSQDVPLAQAVDRVLGQDVAATRTQPPAPVSAMDGYAVRASDVVRAPAALSVIGTAPAGHLFNGRVEPGQAVRIFTGGVMPEGADTVVIQENTEAHGDQVRINEPAKPGAFVRPAGLDFKSGDVLLHAGTLLRPRHIALAAAMNRTHLPVRRKVRVGVLATGDELVPPGTEPGPGQIVSSNNAGIQAFATMHCGDAIDLGIARDTPESLADALKDARAKALDILITLGGASVGDHDLVLSSLQKEGLTLGFWKIAMRPGKPLMYGRLGGTRVLGLPGNPVSTMVCARLFLTPLLAALQGRVDFHDELEQAAVTVDLPQNDQRQDYLRARLERISSGSLTATPYQRQDSSMLAVMASANVLIVRPPHAPAVSAGEKVPFLRIDHT